MHSTYKPVAYWKIVLAVVGLSFATLLVVRKFSITEEMLVSWSAAAIVGSVVFCIAEAVRRMRAR